MKNHILLISVFLASLVSIKAQVCQPTYSTGTSSGDYISQVKLDTINSTTAGASSPYYTYDTAQQTTLTTGQSYWLKIAPGSWSGGGNSIAAWIDYNQNDAFDNNEKLGQKDNLSANTLDSFQFTVPAGATFGQCRLRVREVYNGTNMDACANANYGETEDYVVSIDTTGGTPPTPPPAPQVCVPTYSNGTSFGDYISLVKLDTILAATGGAATPYYTYDTAQQTTLFVGQTYWLKVAPGNFNGNGNNIAAWIDFSRNDTFENSEKLGQLNNMSANTTDSIQFTVPNGSSLGKARLRVREVYNNANIDPCANAAYGETEDYVVYMDTTTITPPPPAGSTFSVTATSGHNGPSSYASLKEAFDSINAGYHTGSIVIAVLDNSTETDSCVLKASGTGNANYTSVLVKPSGGAKRTITMNSDRALIRFNGADNVTIDGLNTGGDSLVIENQHTGAAASTILFLNDASSDTIRNCVLKGGASNVYGGVVSFYTTNLTTGNDNNALVGCDIGKYGNNKPLSGIYSSGSAGKGNDAIFIDHCSIHDFATYGIYLKDEGDNYRVTSNKIYQPDTCSGLTMGIYIIEGSGHVVNYNVIGGNDASNSGYWMLRGGNPYFRGIYVNTPFGSKPITIEGNAIKRIYLFDNDGGSLYGICAQTATTTHINYNDIGEYMNTLSIRSLSNDALRGISTLGYNADTAIFLEDNYVMNVSALRTGSNVTLEGIYHEWKGDPTIKNNVVMKLTSYSTGFYYGTCGIVSNGRSSHQVIEGNEVNGVVNHTSTNSNPTVAGILTYYIHGGHAGSISKNRITKLENTATGTEPEIVGIYVIGSTTPNWKVFNNMITISNSGYSNGVRIHGIFSRAESDTISVYYNSVFVSGSSSGTQFTTAFCHLGGNGQSIVKLRNNLLYNKRTGAGSNYAVSCIHDTTIWGNGMSNYNLFVTADSTKVGMFYTRSLDFAQWKTRTNGDASSWAATSHEVPSDSLFISSSLGFLHIRTGNPVCWYLNGKGVAGNLSDNIAEDLYANARTTTHGLGTDIGASEFTPANGIYPPDMTVTGSHSYGGTETFSFAGRTLASITWGNNGSLPTFGAGTAYYCSGKNPNNAPNGSKHSNCYWKLEPTGGNGYSYTITLYYDEALTGSLTNESNIRMAKKPIGGNVWSHYDGSNTNTNLNTCSYGGLNSFSEFTLSDNVAPLPVTLVSFDAQKVASDVQLKWYVANEFNFDHYEVERSLDNKNWESIATEEPNGNRSVQSYETMDLNVLENHSTLYYRLKMVDNDGKTNYSLIALVQASANQQTRVSVWPNPSYDVLNIISGTTNETMQLTDMSGRIVLPQLKTGRIDISHLPDGIYLLSIVSDAQQQTIRVVKN